MRKNRGHIPPEMQPSRQRAELSSVFGFDRQLTLTSYVPKKGKAVILLSSMHHDDEIDENHSKKPAIIMHYNATKSGVDNLRHFVRFYSCKRKTNRWPMTMLFNIIDCAAVAAYVIWTTKHPEWNQQKNYKRRLFLKELGCQLVETALDRRQENAQAMQKHVKMAFKALGRQVDRPAIAHDPAAAQPHSRRQRCLLCARLNDKKVTTTCSACHNPCCKDHGQFVCDTCRDEADD